jgi:catechol 2,3-dioxygenase-like lactoylglutathione lyase family enzyme
VNDNLRASVHSIDHFALNLRDLIEAHRFVTAFGLVPQAMTGEVKLMTARDGHVWARLIGGDAKGLGYISFGCAASDLGTLRQQAQDAGASIALPASGAGNDGFWITDPDGNLLQVKPAASTQPGSKSSLPDASVPAGVAGVAGRTRAPRVEPTRLSHVLLFTPDVARMIDFYGRALGLNLSDRSADLIAFMHAPHGCDHHLVAFAKSPGRGFHHSSWDVPRIEDVGLGAMQMRKAGYDEHWGVGRHVLGSNYFDYVRDRAGVWWEFSCHIDYVPAGTQWDAGDHPPEDSFYLWGPDVPPTFIENTEAGTATA